MILFLSICLQWIVMELFKEKGFQKYQPKQKNVLFCFPKWPKLLYPKTTDYIFRGRPTASIMSWQCEEAIDSYVW